jgi:hypothetical protein
MQFSPENPSSKRGNHLRHGIMWNGNKGNGKGLD